MVINIEIDDEVKRERILLYFDPPSKSYKKWIFFGILLTVALIGILFIYIGILKRRKYLSKIVTEQEVDKYLREDLVDVHKYALGKLNTDETELVAEKILAATFCICTSPKIKHLGKKGEDDVFRFTPLRVNIINFTAEELMLFQCVLDFTTGLALNHKTQAYFYNDVVSISTEVNTRFKEVKKIEKIKKRGEGGKKKRG